MTIIETIPHALGATEAQRRVERCFSHYAALWPAAGLELKLLSSHPPGGDGCEYLVKGSFGFFKLSGHVFVGAKSVRVEVAPPLLFPKKGVAKFAEQAKSELATWFQKEPRR